MNTEINVIRLLGGPKRVAEMLGFSHEPGAIQRVSNWRHRGIPSGILLAHPEFHRKVKRAMRLANEATHA